MALLRLGLSAGAPCPQQVKGLRFLHLNGFPWPEQELCVQTHFSLGCSRPVSRGLHAGQAAGPFSLGLAALPALLLINDLVRGQFSGEAGRVLGLRNPCWKERAAVGLGWECP